MIRYKKEIYYIISKKTHKKSTQPKPISMTTNNNNTSQHNTPHHTTTHHNTNKSTQHNTTHRNITIMRIIRSHHPHLPHSFNKNEKKTHTQKHKNKKKQCRKKSKKIIQKKCTLPCVQKNKRSTSCHSREVVLNQYDNAIQEMSMRKDDVM
jgi:hypothetical protein